MASETDSGAHVIKAARNQALWREIAPKWTKMPETIAYSLLVLKTRRDALAEIPPGRARDTILASLDEMIAALERGEDPFSPPRS